MPGTPSYNKKEAKKREDAHAVDLTKTKDWIRQQEAAKREQEAYILAEGGDEVGIKSCLHKNRE